MQVYAGYAGLRRGQLADVWVPSSAVRLGYLQIAGAVASGRLAPWRLAHSLAGSVAGRAPACGSVLDVQCWLAV
jgi:hypothetical protein